MLEQKINEFFGDDEPSGFGTGWWSGVLSAFFGLLALGAVVCLHFPQLLSSPELRIHYPMQIMRMLIQGVIVGAIVLGVVSAMLRRKKVLALTGMLSALAATLLGGASVEINEPLHDGMAIGLDWFLLDLLLMTLIFSPIEVLWPAYPKQSVFRNEWLLDVGYFLSTHLPIRITTFLILLPATQVIHMLGNEGLQQAVSSLPWLVQFFLAVLMADLVEYGVHRALHEVPWLWRFHAIHHSSKALDWIAGSRAHLVDDLIIRGVMLIPMMFTFSQDIITAYLLFVTIHATWAHTNFGPNIKWLEPYLVLPRFHHWHHTSQKEAIDKNYSIHFPWIDKLFGTYYLPKEGWPETYGLNNEPLPAGFWGQAFYPFTRRKKAA
jgi:sterol desaturase/sphingolipid hydroxylase (fatty acid hydroxylase superfamily)